MWPYWALSPRVLSSYVKKAIFVACLGEKSDEVGRYHLSQGFYLPNQGPKLDEGGEASLKALGHHDLLY